MAPPGAPRGGKRSPTRPIFFPSCLVLAPEAGTLAVQHPAPGLLPRGALLRNAVPAPDRGSVAAPPTAPEKLRSMASRSLVEQRYFGPSTNEGAGLGLFSQTRNIPLPWGGVRGGVFDAVLDVRRPLPRPLPTRSGVFPT